MKPKKNKYKLKKKYFDGNQKIKSGYEDLEDTSVKSYDAALSDDKTLNTLKANQNTGSAKATNTTQSIGGLISSVNPAIGALVGVGSTAASGVEKGLKNKQGYYSSKGNQIVGQAVSNTLDPASQLFKAADGGGAYEWTNVLLGPLGGVANSLLGNKSVEQKQAEKIQREQDYIKGQTNNLRGYKKQDYQANQIAKDGKKSIYIKPENRGKFNALKKKTGKSTEELTHSKNPLTRKRAIFAQNAAKWKHEEGTKSLVVNKKSTKDKVNPNATKGYTPEKDAPVSTNTYKKSFDVSGNLKYKKFNASANINIPYTNLKNPNTLDLSLNKKVGKNTNLGVWGDPINKGIGVTLTRKFENGSREIESEGREPVFSPKKSDGTRDLLYYNPKAPTHKEGGVDMTVVPKNKYKMKKGVSGVIIPEGSAIVTAKNDKNKKALKAFSERDHKKLEKIINTLPEDKSTKSKKYKSKKSDGSNDLIVDEENTSPNKKWLEDSLFGKDKTLDFTEPSTANKTTADSKPSKLGTSNNILNSFAGAAPAIYDTAQGLFGKTQKVNRRLYNPSLYKYQDMSNPLRRDAEEEYRISKKNIAQATPNASSYLANAAAAANQRYKRKSDINREELNRRMNVNNMNTDLKNQAKLTNTELKNQYDVLDTQAQAKKSEYLGKGLEGLSQIAQYANLNKNRNTSDAQRLKLLETDNYIYDKSGSIVPKAKKGLKNIKYKTKK